ncbi:MAG: hypothetical protein ACYC28_04895 [Longimicrobiales bacterium]
MKIRMSMLAAGAMLAISSAATEAQEYAMAAPRGPEASVTRAERLQEQAEALFEKPKQWKKAQRLLVESAELRDASDVEGYTCYMLAGRLAAALGDNEEARESLEEAGEHALARGAVVDAASAFIDAAHAAARSGDAVATKELMERAKLLANSPLISPEERSALEHRLRA